MSRTQMQAHREHGADEGRMRPQNGPQWGPCHKIQLTAMEYKVLWCLKEGSRDSEIADRLGISHRTASHHVTRILGELSARNRTQAVVKALSIRIRMTGG